MSTAHRTIGCLLIVFLPIAASGQRIEFVDDLDQAIETVLEICGVVGTAQECRDVASGEVPVEIAGLGSPWTVEGERHGPVTWRGTASADGEIGQIRVPRKALLTLHEDVGFPGVDVAAYDAAGPLVRALEKARLEPDDEIYVPARPLVVSLRARDDVGARGQAVAPDLRYLAPEPGQIIELTPAVRRGWSAVLRLADSTDRSIAGQTKVTTSNPFGFEPPDASTAEPTIRQHGDLVLVSGIAQPIVQADVSADGYLPHRVEALSATPGSFAVHDVVFQCGGTVALTVTLHGDPVRGGRCLVARDVIDTTRPPTDEERSRPPRDVLGTATTDRDGACSMAALRPGAAVASLEIETADRPRDGDMLMVEQAVLVVDGETTRLHMDLEPLRVTGTVIHGDEPAEGYRIVAHAMDRRLGTDRGRIASEPSGDQGEYALTVWRPDDYALVLEDADGTPADMQRLRLEHDEVIDWTLRERGIEGRVVDAEGVGVGAVTVRLFWRSGGRSSRLARTGDDGSFSFPLRGERGTAMLQATSASGDSSETVELELDLEPTSDEPPFVTLRLDTAPARAGRLLRADGRPAVPAWIRVERKNHAPSPFDRFSPPRTVAVTTTDLDGGFEVSAPPVEPLTVLFGGPGCPLGARHLPPKPADSASRATFRCAAEPSNLLLRLDDATGAPVESAGIILRRGDLFLTTDTVGSHLGSLGLPTRSDGAGRLALVALEPGTYDVFLADGTSVFDIAAGQAGGFLRTVTLEPWATKELEVTIAAR